MKRHILFVDDEVPIRETLSIYFKMKGLDVTTAGNAEAALGLMETTRFDLGILDVGLGTENEDGVDLLEQIKLKHPALPVIMFSSLENDGELVERALAKGALSWTSKAEPIDRLFSAAQRALGQTPALKG